jgi:hypothetical protein
VVHQGKRDVDLYWVYRTVPDKLDTAFGGFLKKFLKFASNKIFKVVFMLMLGERMYGCRGERRHRQAQKRTGLLRKVVKTWWDIGWLSE